MREIKFRAYDGLNGEMVYSDKKQSDYGFNLDSGVVRCYAEVATVDVCGDDYIDFEYLDNIMQYIGLKDINGKEIYEEDIVERKDRTPIAQMFGETVVGVVGFNNGSFVLNTDEGIYSMNNNKFSNMCSYRVIGNIYENLELVGE